jgi:hypothetical protein
MLEPGEVCKQLALLVTVCQINKTKLKEALKLIDANPNVCGDLGLW